MSQKNSSRYVKGILCAISAAVIYGFSFLFTKRVTDTIAPFYLLAWRFGAAFAAMTVCVLLRIFRIDLKGKNLSSVLRMSVFFPICYFFTETLGVQRTTASESGVIIACIPVVGLIASTIVLKRRPNRLQVLGVIISMIGVIMGMLGKGLSASLDVLGYILLFITITSFSMYEVSTESIEEFTSTEKTYVLLGVGAVFFLLLAGGQSLIKGEFLEFITLPLHNDFFMAAILYLSIGCSVIAFILDNYGLAALGTNTFSTFAPLSTVVTVISSVIILREPFSLLQVVGGVLVLAGVYTANASQWKKNAASASSRKTSSEGPGE